MMTLPLDAEEIEFYRSLKKTAIVLMLLFRLDRPVGESDIARMLDMYPTTVRNYLRSLARSGVVTRTHRYQGWMLTAGGRQMILGKPVHALLPDNSGAEQEPEERKVNDSRSSGKISRSAAGYKVRKHRNSKQSVEKGLQTDARVQENLATLRSIGVAENEFVLETSTMKHVNPSFILGQKNRLEAERRYSPGLLLTVIRCKDHLEEKYRPRERDSPTTDLAETEPEPEEQPEPAAAIEADPSIHEAIGENGMTAMKAWATALGQLKADMPKASYDQWVRKSVLLCAKDGIFVIGTCSDYACEWLASRLSSTIKRLLAGICNRAVEVQFVNVFEIKDRRQLFNNFSTRKEPL